MKLSSSLALVLPLLLANSTDATASVKDVDKCVACYGLAAHVETRMSDTEARANEEIPIGVRIGPDGEPIPKTVVRYGESYIEPLVLGQVLIVLGTIA